MEDDPFALVEAMTIAGFATGCERGFLYLRGEYPLAAERMAGAIAAARAAGLLGADVMGAGFAFDIEIRRGAGAYICGEETALFNSIEGKRGEPRNKPPFPVAGRAVRQADRRQQRRDAGQRAGDPPRGRRGLRRHRHQRLDRAEALLRVGPRRAPRPLRGPVRDHAACSCSTWPAASRRPALQAVLLGGAAGVFVGPDELDIPLTFEGTRAISATLGSGVVMVFDETRRSARHRCGASPSSSATSRAASACPAGSAPCARRSCWRGCAPPAGRTPRGWRCCVSSDR